MKKAITHALILCCLLAAGCKQETPEGATVSTTDVLLSLKLLDGVVARHVAIQVMGQSVEATILWKDLGKSALFLCYYTLPSPAVDRGACDAAINAEIDRCVANTGSELLSRKVFPAAQQPTSEVVARSPNRKGLSLRFRVICTGKEIQSLTAVTPDNQDASHSQAVDKMFEEFNAK
jgi:hypothetical protein